MRALPLIPLLALTIGCVPNDPPPPKDKASAAKPPERRPEARPASSLSRPGLPRRSGLSPAASGAPVASAAPETPDPPLAAPYVDTFDRAEPGADWALTSPKWRIEGGQLCVKGARNHPAWLRRRLPLNARIEFDATSKSPDGDIKAEFWGDGRSAARAATYDHATSYLTIFGGWKNQFHVLARIDEHAANRPEIKVDSDMEDLRTRRVESGQGYHFKVERNDGKTVRWYVDDIELLSYPDPEPLQGPGHEHFAFNDWDVPVCFDNLKIMPLP